MRPVHGILLKLCSVVILVVMSSIIKAYSQDVPPGQAVFFRSFFAIPVILVWVSLRGEIRSGLRVNNVMSHVWRGGIGTCAMVLYFASLGMLPLPEVMAIGYAAPLMVVILAAIFLGEKVRGFRITAVVIGLVGVLVVLSPRLSAFGAVVDERAQIGAMVVLASALFVAISQIVLRKIVDSEHTAAIVFYYSIISSLLALCSAPFGWTMPGAEVFLMLILAGLMGGAGQIFLTSSYRHADVSVIAPFDYASMILALLIGYFVFDEVPTMVMLSGASLVISAGVFIIWREHKLGLERAKQRKAATPGG
ncbi:MAG: DMT family transporter [Marinosulfonomonas sp.]|nr:DMT family transporter [Marinosulfonomonas sp.]